MAQYLSNLGQGSTGAQQLSCQAVSEDVRPWMGRLDASSRQRSMRNPGHARAVGEANMRCQFTQKHSPTLGARSIVAKIIRDRGTDLSGQWHPRTLATLPANRQMTRPPIDILKTQRRHLRGS
jgi:hypothetical protein